MSKTISNTKVKFAGFCLVSLCVVVSGERAAARAEIICYDYIDKHGVLKGGIIAVDATNPYHTVVEGPKVLQAWNVETIIDNGPTWNRVDLAVLGDGYQEPELGVYATDVANLMAGFFAEPPLDEYASFFNVHRVDVISNQSGVFDCPAGDTALKMCYDDRWLGINVWLAKQAADSAPDWDQILALANSAQYGGAGYFNDNIATLSGHEEFGWTNELALHEFGHSFAKLRDEYWERDWVYVGGGTGAHS